MKKDSKSESSANLRKQAEALNRKRPLKSSSRPDDNKMRKLIQELETHQIELESQNEELRLAKAQITADAVKYAELYDFAPSGYFTLANNSEIIELNLCGSQMLGKERMFLKTQQFGLYVSDDDKTVFNRFLDKVFHNKSTETCEVALLVNGNPPIYVNLSGTATENGEQCLVIATDITSRKNAEIALAKLAEGWQTTFDATNDMIWLLDKDQQVVRLNKASEQFCKRPVCELIGAHCWELMHGTKEPISNCPFIKTMKSHKHEYTEIQIGKEWFGAAVDPIIDASGQYAGAVHIVSNITERKQNEALLSDSFDRLRKIASRVPGVVYQFRLRPDGSSCFPFASEAINTIYRVTPDEVREDASKVFAVLHPDDYDNIVASIQKSARELTPWQHEYRVKFDDGTVRFLFGNAIPQLEEDGSVLWHGFITDVTERKRLEESVLESERRLRRVNESGMLAMFYWNNNGQITEANDKFLEMIGYTRDELEEGMIDWMKMTPPEFKYKDDNALIELKAYGNISLPYEKEYIRKNGTRFPILITAATLDNHRLGGVAFTIDITEQKRTEQALLLKNLTFDTSIAANSIAGPDGIINEANNAFLKMWGFATREEVIGKPISHFLYYSEEVMTIIKALNEQDEWEGEYTGKKKDGAPFLAYGQATTLKDKNGNLLGYQSSVIDITEPKRLEEKLLKSEQRLRRVSESGMLGMFYWNENGQITEANDKFLEMIGYTRDELEEGMIDWMKMTPPEFKYKDDNALIELKAYGNVSLLYEKEYIRKDGTRFPILITAATLDNQRLGGVAFIIDITEQKQAEEALRIKNLAFDTSIEANSIAGSDGIIKEANNAFLKMWGFATREEVLGKPISHFHYYSEDVTTIMNALNEQNEWAGEYTGKKRDGSAFLAYGQATTLRDKNDNLIGYQSSFIDITERKRLEKKVLEGEQRLRRVSESGMIGMFYWNDNGQITEANDKFLEMIGYTRNELEDGKIDWIKMTPPEFKYKDDNALIELKAYGNISSPYEKEFVRKDGTRFPILITAASLDNQRLGGVAFIIDISEQKKTEKELLKREFLYRTLFEEANIGILYLTTDLKIKMVNAAFAQMHGYSIEELQSMSLKDMDTPETLLHSSERTAKLLNGVTIRFEVEHVHKDGHIFPLEVSANLITVEDEPIIQAFNRDITEQKRAYESLHESEKQHASLFNNFLDGVAVHQIVLDETGKPVDYIFLQANAAFETQTGLHVADILGKLATKVIPGIEKTPFIDTYGKVALTGEPITFDQFSEPLNRYFHINAFKNSNSQFCTVFQDITQIKLAEKALLENEAKFRNLVWSMQTGVLLQGPNAEIILCNPKALELLGITEDQLLGKTSFDPDWNVIHEDGSPFPGSTHPVPQAIASRQPVRDVVMGVFRPGKGDRVWLLVDAEPQLNENSNIQQVVCTFVDITDRKLAEEELRENERKFRDTVTNLDEGYYSVTIDGVVLDHNKAFCKILGFESSVDLKGTFLPDYWQIPDKRHEYLKILTANGSVSNYLIKTKTASEEKKTVLSSAHLVTEKGQNQPRIEGIFLDITERIRLEESLHRHANRLQNLHKIDKEILSPLGTPEAIIQNSLQHIRSLLSSQHASIGIFDFENEALQLFVANIRNGLTDQVDKYMVEKAYDDLEILRQNRIDVIEDISAKSSPPELLRILQSEGIMSCINVPLVSGEKLIGAMNLGWADPREFTPEELEIASEVADEITIAIEQVRLRQETKQYASELEERVEKRTAQLTAANKELEAFSYSVSHDLRAPLRHIKGYISILSKHLQNTLPEKEKHYFDTISESARQMGVLIDDLLQFSRTGRQEMNLNKLDMNIVLQDALQVIKHESNGRSIKWKIAEMPSVIGDYALLRLVWLNLLSNAVKFSKANVLTQIEIGVVDDRNEFVFFVSDNGVGFDMQYAQKLFGVFERLHSTLEFEGTGIGLANVRRIISRHGGLTWAEAEVDRGATFYFTLPKV